MSFVVTWSEFHFAVHVIKLMPQVGGFVSSRADLISDSAEEKLPLEK